MSEYSDLDRQIEQLKRCEIIKENEVKVLCAKAREILVEEGNVQRVDSPVTVKFIGSSSFATCRISGFHTSSAYRSAVIFMGNSMILKSSSRLGATFPRPTTCSWVTLSTEDTTRWKRFSFFWL